MIFNDSQLDDFFKQLNIAYSYGLFHEHTVSDFYHMIKEMNVATDASNEYNQQHLNHFEMAHADQDCESYMPIKRNSEQPQVEHTSVDLESFDMTRLVTSTYLANYFLSQSNQVTLGIHFQWNMTKLTI